MVKDTALKFLRRDVSNETLQALLETDTGTPRTFGRKQYPWDGSGSSPGRVRWNRRFHHQRRRTLRALGSGPLPGPYFSSGILASSILLAAGSEEQKTRYLADIATGEKVLTLALTEPTYSWEPASVVTTAVPRGDDFVLDG